MSLQDDFRVFAEKTSGNYKDYLRLIWEETQVGADWFDDIFYLDHPETIRQAVRQGIGRLEDVSAFRRNMYLRFLTPPPQQGDTFPAWLAELNQIVPTDEEKKSYIAKYLTRLLRGENSDPHNTPQDARGLLQTPGLDVWVTRFNQLNNRCCAWGIQ